MAQAFVKLVNEKYKVRCPDHDFSQAYDTAQIIKLALKKAKLGLTDATLKDDRKAIRDALADRQGLQRPRLGSDRASAPTARRSAATATRPASWSSTPRAARTTTCACSPASRSSRASGSDKSLAVSRLAVETRSCIDPREAAIAFATVLTFATSGPEVDTARVRAAVTDTTALADVASRRAAPSWLDRVHPIVPWLIGCVLLLPLPLADAQRLHQFVVNVMCINILLAVGLNIVKGFAGQVTVGHVALMAIGAYASAVISQASRRAVLGRAAARHAGDGLRRRAGRHSLAAARRRLSGAGDARPRRKRAHHHLRHRVSRRRRRLRGHPAALSVRPRARQTSRLLLRRHAAGAARHLFLVLDPVVRHRPRLQVDPRGPAGGGGQRRQRHEVQGHRLRAVRALCGLRRQPQGAHGAGLPATRTATRCRRW